MTTDLLYTDFGGLTVGVCLRIYEFIKLKANRIPDALQYFIGLA
jgi:hypothetical protein